MIENTGVESSFQDKHEELSGLNTDATLGWIALTGEYIYLIDLAYETNTNLDDEMPKFNNANRKLIITGRIITWPTDNYLISKDLQF